MLETLSPSQLDRLEAELSAQFDRRKIEERLAFYRPYPKQAEFHAAGATARERLCMAANQSGKTLSGGFEVAMHATGRYPPWWRGKRFDRPTMGWVAGDSNEVTRDVVQRTLIGRPGAKGQGTIPAAAIAGITTGRGIADLADAISVRHVSGGISTIGIKSYARGRESFQGETLDYAWLDEEPPADIYTEVLTRTNVGQGPIWITFTPISGMSEVVRRFLLEPSSDRSVITMTIDDVAHFTAEERAAIIASYPAHEREARTRGVPTLGSGRIFPVSEDSIACEPREFPEYFVRIGGMDFGWDHPFAAVEVVWDRDADVVYVARCLRIREATPVQHAAALRHWGAGLPWSWPRDGGRQTLEGAGVALAKQYEREGLYMLAEHAQFEDKSGQRRGRRADDVGPHANGEAQGFQALRRLVRRVPALSPQRWPRGEARR